MNSNKSTIEKVLFTIFIFIAFLSCNYEGDEKKVDKETDVESISTAIHNCIGWAKEKDFKLLYRIIANDSGIPGS